MTLIKYRPSQEVDYFDKGLTNFFNALFDNKNDLENLNFYPKSNIIENEDSYNVKLDVPGLGKDQINVSFKNNVLSVSGERSEEKIDENKKYLSKEVVYGKFERSFNLPDGVDESKIEAKLENGVLSFFIPKPQKQIGKEINIKVK